MRAWHFGLIALLAASGGVARGDGVELIAVAGESRCPAPAAVAAALADLLPAVKVVVGEGTPAARIADEGASYRVGVAGRERRFRDLRRRCDERARSAAVFIALTLAPPSVALPLPADPIDEDELSPEGPRRSPPAAERGAPPTGTPPAGTAATGTAATGTAPTGTAPTTGTAPPTPTPTPTRTPDDQSRRWRIGVALEALALVEGAPRTAPDNSLLTGGGALRLHVGATPFSVALGAGGRAPVTLDVVGGSANITYVPFDLDLRTALRRGPVELAAEVGLAATLLVVAGQGFRQSESASRLELGVRIAGSFRRWFGERFGLVVGLEGRVVPRPFELTVSPAQVVGNTPRLWLGIFAGAIVRLR